VNEPTFKGAGGQKPEELRAGEQFYIIFSLFCSLNNAICRKTTDPIERIILFLNAIIAKVVSFTEYGTSYGFKKTIP
jgi:hypothetical protein